MRHGSSKPGRLDGRPTKELVGDRVRRLFEFPEVFGKSGHRRGRIEHNLGAVETEAARAFGEVAIVANVDAHLADPRREDRIAKVAGPEIKLLKKARIALGDVRFTVLAQVRAVGVDDRGGVVIDPGQVFLVNGHDEANAVLFGQFHHQFGCRPVGNALGERIPL